MARAGFFRECLAKDRREGRDDRRWRECIYAEIRSRMQSQGGLSIRRMCELAGVSLASFYRHWEDREPAAAETELRGAVQRLALTHRYYGYRRIAVLLQRESADDEEQVEAQSKLRERPSPARNRVYERIVLARDNRGKEGR